MDLWPRRLLVYLNARRVAHNDIDAWTKRFTPPVCALMPDKLPDPAANALNQANFAKSQPHAAGKSDGKPQGARNACSVFDGLTSRPGGAGPVASREPARRRYDDLPDVIIRFPASRCRVFDRPFPRVR
jgi:hypothetical protein